MERVNESHGSTDVLSLFAELSERVAEILADNTDWGWSGRRESQYAVDVAADEAIVPELHRAGFDVLSEESGITTPDGSPRPDKSTRPIVVVDPIDGSTNARLGLPWCATALCLVVDGSPEIATVANLRTGERYEAIRGRGAWRNGDAINTSPTVSLSDAVVAVNSYPPRDLGARQFRVLGATALDICSVAAGGLDAYLDCDDGKIAVWDYLASLLVLDEAGGVSIDRAGRDLVVLDHESRRGPIVASGPELLDEVLDRVR